MYPRRVFLTDVFSRYFFILASSFNSYSLILSSWKTYNLWVRSSGKQLLNMSTISCLTCKQNYFGYILFLVFIQVHWNYTDVVPVLHANLTSYPCAHRKFGSKWNLFIKADSSKGIISALFSFHRNLYSTGTYNLYSVFSFCCLQTLKKKKEEKKSVLL